MAKKSLIILIFINLLIYTSHLNAYLSTNVIENNNLIEKVEFGQINWTRGVITIYAETTLPKIIKNDKNGLIKQFPEKYIPSLPRAREIAKRKAYQNARQNLYNAILNLRIKNNFYVKSYLTTHSTNDFKFQLNNFLQDKLIPKYIYKNNSIRVEIKIKLFSELNTFKKPGGFVLKPLKPPLNYNRFLLQKGIISIFTNDYQPELIPFYTETNYKNYIQKVISATSLIPQTYTSLIIDATELKKLKPALFPTIYNESRKEIYSSKILFKDKVGNKGIVTYIPDISLIEHFEFVDSKAFIIKAVKIINKTDLILPNEELKQFLSSEETVKYLQNCNVLIILDK